MFCDPDKEVAHTGIPTQKRYFQCGSYTTVCGKGRQELFIKLGTDQDEALTVWFNKTHFDDVIEVWQYDLPVAIAPNLYNKGSFSFDWAPHSEEKDELRIVFVETHLDSKAEIKVMCPEGCLTFIEKQEVPQPTSILCGRTKIQAGHVGRNTVELGSEDGWVDVLWEISGSALIQFYQGLNLIHEMHSNRNGEKTFWYDAAKGPLEVITHGIADVSYVVSCPYLIEEEEVPKYAFNCGTTPMQYAAPLNLDLVLPNIAGNINFNINLSETVALTLLQDTHVVYSVQHVEGLVEFSFDYDPANGPIKIETQGYGNFSINVTCPEEEIIPDVQTINLDCGPTYVTINGYSDTTINFGNTHGSVTLDFLSSDNLYLYFGAARRLVEPNGRQTFDWNGEPVRVESRGRNYQMRAECPVPYPPAQLTTGCNANYNYTGPAEVNFSYGQNAILGNVNIKSQRPVALYKNEVLVGVGTDLDVYYDRSPIKIIDLEPSANRVSSTCPQIKTFACNSPTTEFLANDVVDLRLAGIAGESTFTIEIIGNVETRWRLNNAAWKTITETTTFTHNITASDNVRIVSSGTGKFKLNVPCVLPPTVVSRETITTRQDCAAGQTLNGVLDGVPYLTGTHEKVTWSDGRVVESNIVWNGVCRVQPDRPIPPAKFGVGMFSNVNFTGGIEIYDQEELDWGLSLTNAPEGTPYKKWSGLNAFVADVMTGSVTPATSHTSNTRFDLNLKPDHYAYIMWDARGGNIEIMDVALGFTVTWTGINWRNDQLGNNDGMPNYNPNLSPVKEILFDDGYGERLWKIMRMETYPFSPTTKRFSVRYT